MDTWTSVIRDGLTDPCEQKEVYSILEECDGDFVPPLSARQSTFQADLKQTGQPAGSGVADYFEEVRKQTTLLIKADGRTVAFISYRYPYACEALKAYSEVAYLTTMCVRKSERGKGLSRMLYETIIRDIQTRHPQAAITLRTWNTNQAQMHLMPELGFRCVATLKDDRGAGIDTMYFVLER